MKYRILIAVMSAAILWFASQSASAQSRPQCDADPVKPGACFEPATAGGALGCDDGVVFLAPVEAKRAFNRVNPNGKMAIYRTAEAVPAAACTAEDFFAGICFFNPDGSPSSAFYVGQVRLHTDGFVGEGGGLSCPFKSTVKGVMFRDVGYGPEEAEIDAVVHTVKDKASPTGCLLRVCRVFAVDGGPE